MTARERFPRRHLCVQRLMGTLFLTMVAASLFHPSWVTGLAQNPDDGLSFEVASLKPAAPGQKAQRQGGPGTENPERITLSGFPFDRLILIAYNLQEYQLRGPAWMPSERYDIVAKVPPGATPEQAAAMLRNLLRQRFAMTLHYETSEHTVYDLEAGSRPSMKISAQDTPREDAFKPPPILTSGPDGFPQLPRDYVRAFGAITMIEHGLAKTTAAGESMAKFAEHLSRKLQQPVVDRTGLSGTYDFELIWLPESAPATDSAVGPSLAEAIQKLGLRLHKRKAPLQILVIDYAEKKPEENE